MAWVEFAVTAAWYACTPPSVRRERTTSTRGGGGFSRQPGQPGPGPSPGRGIACAIAAHRVVYLYERETAPISDGRDLVP